MARVKKPEAFAAKRTAILVAAQRLIFTKGYDQMSIQDVLNELQISGGAFRHYFDSRTALLDALIERIRHESGEPLEPIVHDRELTAIQKLQRFFAVLDRLRTARRRDILSVMRMWYSDGNAIVRQRVSDAIVAQRAPWLTEIVRQGVRDCAFSTRFPDEAGEVLMALLQNMGDTHVRLLLAAAEEADPTSRVDALLVTHAAYMEAIERILGAPPHCLHRADAEAVKEWVRAISQ